MFGQRPRRWPNIEPTLIHRLLFAGTSYDRQRVTKRLENYHTEEPAGLVPSDAHVRSFIKINFDAAAFHVSSFMWRG